MAGLGQVMGAGMPGGIPPEVLAGVEGGGMVPPPPGGPMPGGPMPGGPVDPMMAAAMGGGEADMLGMMFDQVAGGLNAQQAQIAGVEDMLMQALMEAAAALAPPDPAMMMPMEGVPMGAGPGPAGPPPVPETEADMLAGMV